MNSGSVLGGDGQGGALLELLISSAEVSAAIIRFGSGGGGGMSEAGGGGGRGLGGEISNGGTGARCSSEWGREPTATAAVLIVPPRLANEIASIVMAREPSSTPSTARRKVQGERGGGSKYVIASDGERRRPADRESASVARRVIASPLGGSALGDGAMAAPRASGAAEVSRAARRLATRRSFETVRPLDSIARLRNGLDDTQKPRHTHTHTHYTEIA